MLFSRLVSIEDSLFFILLIEGRIKLKSKVSVPTASELANTSLLPT